MPTGSKSIRASTLDRWNQWLSMMSPAPGAGGEAIDLGGRRPAGRDRECVAQLRSRHGAVGGVSLVIGAGEFVSLLGRPARARRRSHDAAPASRSRTAGRSSRRPRGHPCPAQLTRRCHGVPALRAVSAYDGRREHRLSAEDARHGRSAAATSRSSGAPLVKLTGYDERKPAEIIGRPAAARRARPSHCVRSTRRPHGRAPRRARSKLRQHMQIELKQLQQRLGATGGLRYARPRGSAAYVGPGRDHRRAASGGTPRELYDRPSDTFVARLPWRDELFWTERVTGVAG